MPDTKQEIKSLYTTFLEKWKKIDLLYKIGGFLGWDQQTYMPKKEEKSRIEQHALIAELTHAHLTDDDLYTITAKLLEHAKNNSLNQIESANVNEAWRQIQFQRTLPMKLVRELAKETSAAHSIWVEARKSKDWKLFAPTLQKIIALVREKAYALQESGIGSNPYEALFFEYAWGLPLKTVDSVFQRLKTELPPLIETINSSENHPDDSILFKNYDRAKQEIFSREIISAMHFDWEAGRLDTSTHPFTNSSGYGIARITSRYRNDYIADSIFSAIHEAGHALYEQGLSDHHMFHPIGAAHGLDIHESQSRFWDCWIGRSYEFWIYFFPSLQKHFVSQLAHHNAEQFYRAVNKVSPGFIRVDSDPLTYNLHIALRWETEKMLIENTIQAKEVPDLWNEKFEKYFGVRPPDDAKGCLQDVHWSHGAFGYFPTYTIGNIIGAHLYHKIKIDVPEIKNQFARGDFHLTREWLREKIHTFGRLYDTAELITMATGEPLSVDIFLHELKERYSHVYNIAL